MKNLKRQAERGTLRVCPGFNNDSVFECFDRIAGGLESARVKLEKPEALLRMRAGRSANTIEKCALAICLAKLAGQFRSTAHGFEVYGLQFRRQISSEADAAYVLARIRSRA